MSEMTSIQDDRLIAEMIEMIGKSAGASISFHDYMNMCLYHPHHGYYMKPQSKIGRTGDFYTSASIGTLMGEMLAHKFARFFINVHGQAPYRIAEWGGGTGRLAGHILDELQQAFPDIYDNLIYDLIDTSVFHQELQQGLLRQHAGKVRLVKTETWWNTSLTPNTIIFSNELLDAFPVHRIKKVNDVYQEVYVGWNESASRFFETLRPIADNEELVAYVETHGIDGSEGQYAEVNLAADRWIARVGALLESGLLLTIDYGHTAEELYAPHRHNGTLMCYHRHKAADNPYIHIGCQDITAHINFSACIRSGIEAGLSTQAFVTQKQFLSDMGIMQRLKDHTLTDPFHPLVRRNRTIRQLLLSDGMSELFKVLIQHKER